MEYIKAINDDLDFVYDLVQETIKNTYNKYYKKEVVDFFSNHHKKENILKDINNNYVYLLKDNNNYIGTGSIINNHITRVFILPKYQGKGYGNKLMSYLESVISNKFDYVCLDSSLAAIFFYEKRNYKTIKHESIKLDSGDYLVYEIMEKNLTNNKFNYDGKIFIPFMNSENGEVDNNTHFYYHQKGNLLWAEYNGGDIKKGFLIGNVLNNGELEFNYQHLNINDEIRIGKCHSKPVLLENGKIRLNEEWQWLNKDNSKGVSILIEE